MKPNSLLLLISGIVLSFTACNKGNASGPNYPVDGKWQQTKLRLYGDSLGVITYDTTYTKPFTALEYVQFNANGTCTESSDHYYYPNILNYPKIPQLIPAIVDTFKFNSIGASAYVLNTQTEWINYGGFVVTDTVKVLSAHTLLLHAVIYSHDPNYSNVADSYYEK